MAKILIIDDDKDFTTLLGKAVEARGYEVECLNNSGDAVYRTINFSPDLILLDIRMPGTNGISVLNTIRSYQRTKHIPVIFISAFADEIDKAKNTTQAEGFFRKPLDSKQLLEKIQDLVH